MFIITVTFILKPGKAGQFMPLMLHQARQSLQLETGCQQFEVCVDTEDENRVFLYESYNDKMSFDIHLASEHFQEFNKNAEDCLLDKRVDSWNLMEQTT